MAVTARAARPRPGEDQLPPAPFDGFGPGAFGFLRGIAEHQTAAWMAANREIYEAELRQKMASLLHDLSLRMARIKLPLMGDPKRGVFRLNRDIRFSNDKRPYKTHAGAVLTRTGEKRAPGLLYIHIDPEGSFCAGGFFRPDPKVLDRLRAGLMREPGGWGRVIKALGAAKLELEHEDTLAKPPKGFGDIAPALHADIRLKSWIVRRALPPAVLGQAHLLDELVDFAKAAAPLLKFGWAALDHEG